ncbi:Methylsterol monooxygenase, partial [Smittium culicis]
MANGTFKSVISYLIETYTSVCDISEKVPLGYSPTKFESLWLSTFEGRNEALTFGAILMLHHMIVFYLRFAPFYIADKIPLLKKYKIQENKSLTDEQWWKCFWSMLKSQIFIQSPLVMLFLPIANFVGFNTSVPFPSFSSMVPQILCFFVIEDFYHYWMHRLFHWGPLYKAIHKVHHEFTAPSGIATEYAHPLETLVFVFGVMLGPLSFCYYFGNVHVISMFFWITFKLCQSVEAHSGYDIPFSISYFFPLWANPDHHDYHHMAFVNNFASS